MFAVVLDQFVQQCPLAVMARMTLQRALRPEWVDALFESHREWQYTRELTFSTVVEITSLVALGMSPSPHAAARRGATLTVSMAALYAKVNRTEPALLRALVRGSAEQLQGGVRGASARGRVAGEFRTPGVLVASADPCQRGCRVDFPMSMS